MDNETWVRNIMGWRKITFDDIINYQNGTCCLYPIERYQWVKFFSEWDAFPFVVSRETHIL